MVHYDKKVVDFVDRLLELEHTKNDNSFRNRYYNVSGRINAIDRVNKQLLQRLDNLAKRGVKKVKKGSEAEFVINAMNYTEDMKSHLENAWGYPCSLSDRYYDIQRLESILDKSNLPKVNRTVVDWFDKVVQQDYDSHLFDKKTSNEKCGSYLLSIERVNKRLELSVDKMPKDFNSVKNDPKKMFVLNAKIYSDRLLSSLKDEIYSQGIVQNKSNQYFNIVNDKDDKLQ